MSRRDFEMDVLRTLNSIDHSLKAINGKPQLDIETIRREIDNRIILTGDKWASTFPPLVVKDIFPNAVFEGKPVSRDEYIRHYDEYVKRCSY